MLDVNALNRSQLAKKRVFDFLLSLFLLAIFLPLILIAWILASLDTRQNGLFVQKRVGQFEEGGRQGYERFERRHKEKGIDREKE